MNIDDRPIVLTLGDRYRIGPEIVVRAVADRGFLDAGPICIVGDWRVFEDTSDRLGLSHDIHRIGTPEEANDSGLSFVDVPFEAPVGPLGKVSQDAGAESLAILRWLGNAISQRSISGAVYAPLNKQAMRDAGHVMGDELDCRGSNCPAARI